MMEFVNGGICAAKGFKASGVHCGIRKNKTKKDLALIVSEKRAAVAATFTTNLVKGAPIAVTRANIADGYAQAVICNSGNANTCNANGVEIAEGMCALVEQYTGISQKDVVVASTGVIGQQMTIDPIADGMQSLMDGLGENSKDAAHAIMTTDTKLKEVALSFEIGGKVCSIGGIAKGSGMIHPNMATMLCFLTTDTAITPNLLQKALSATIVDTFNMISIDGDTSTNDTVAILANGMAENPCITEEGEDFDTFCKALKKICVVLSKKIAADGEGATKLLVCTVSNAETDEIARAVSKSVICSSLLKAAMFGADANWGRVLCAIGYSGAPVDIHKIDVRFKSEAGAILVCENGMGTDFSEAIAKDVLMCSEILIDIDLKSGDASASAYGCDLTYDYVKINGDYRT